MNIWSLILEEVELNRKIIFIKGVEGIRSKIENYFCFLFREIGMLTIYIHDTILYNIS